MLGQVIIIKIAYIEINRENNHTKYCLIVQFSGVFQGDSLGIIKYHSNQYVRCWKQWRTDELVDVIFPSGAHGKVFWWFLDLSQFASN